MELHYGIILRQRKQPYLNKVTAPEAFDWCIRILSLHPPPRQPSGPPGVCPGNRPGHSIICTPETVHNLGGGPRHGERRGPVKPLAQGPTHI